MGIIHIRRRGEWSCMRSDRTIQSGDGSYIHVHTYLAFVAVVRFDIGAIQLTYRGVGGKGKAVQRMEEERGNEGK